MLSLMLAYLVGALSVLILEAGLLFYFLKRLGRRTHSRAITQAEATPDLVSFNSSSFFPSKQGKIWVAVIGLLDKQKDTDVVFTQQGKGIKEPKAKKDSFKEVSEVSPVQKYAKLKGPSLILRDLDGSEEVIELGGCDIRAVSGGDQYSRKWAKRYPIKLESKNRVLFHGSRVCFMYFETSWDKEAWCQSLRLASRTKQRGSDAEVVNWYCSLKKEFEQYFLLVNKSYPSFLKLNPASTSKKERDSREVVVSSKVRQFLKKIVKKAPKTVQEMKPINRAASSREEEKNSNRGCTNVVTPSPTSLSGKADSAGKDSDIHLHTESSQSAFSSSGSLRQPRGVSDIDSEKSSVGDTDADHMRDIGDQGTTCCNLLFSRLFFDAKRSPEVVACIQALIQRLLSKVRTPSYIGGITCTCLDLGKLPPHICNMRVLPVSSGEAWALEADVEYFGGALMDIETRLEVCEPGFQEKLGGTSIESQIVVEATTELLNKESESFREQLQSGRDTIEKMDERETSDGMEASNVGCRKLSLSRWKGMLSHLADQVSQVPLALSIRVVSLKGTVRISIKPPPSDSIWFGFTSEPDIEWGFEPSIGDRKITSGKIATLIASRIKAAIRETMVLPNYETIYIPWMQAEKDDWVPQRIAPVPWICQESSDDTSLKQQYQTLRTEDDGHLLMDDCKSGTDKHLKDDAKNASTVVSEFVLSDYTKEQANCRAISSQTTATKSSVYNGSDNLLLPQGDKDESQETSGIEVQNDLVDPSANNDRSIFETDWKTKKGLKRAKMLDFGKKVGVKFEERRRHIEEKGRHIVGKMRGVEKNEGAVSGI